MGLFKDPFPLSCGLIFSLALGFIVYFSDAILGRVSLFLQHLSTIALEFYSGLITLIWTCLASP
jgi:hypothetical protein